MKSTTLQRDCLVAVVTNDADLARFATERWYRIPARAIGRTLAADALTDLRHIALYQTCSVTAGLPGAVELHGAVSSITTEVRRALLPDEPDHPHAHEEYHVVRVGAVERLEHPLVSLHPRRITFLRTARERLLAARDVNDLYIGTVVEEELWCTLRELGAQRRCFMNVSDQVMEVDFAIVNGARAVGVICGGEDAYEPAAGAWSVVRFSHAELERDLARCLSEIIALLRE
jgi:hypothetical protein